MGREGIGSKDALSRCVRVWAQNWSRPSCFLTSIFPRLYSYTDYGALYAAAVEAVRTHEAWVTHAVCESAGHLTLSLWELISHPALHVRQCSCSPNEAADSPPHLPPSGKDEWDRSAAADGDTHTHTHRGVLLPPLSLSVHNRCNSIASLPVSDRRAVRTLSPSPLPPCVQVDVSLSLLSPCRLGAARGHPRITLFLSKTSLPFSLPQAAYPSAHSNHWRTVPQEQWPHLTPQRRLVFTDSA